MELANFSTGNDYLDPSIENYIMHGLQPGSFLTSAIAGNHDHAYMRADYWNKKNLTQIMQLLDCYLPPAAKGSYDAVDDWINDVDGRRTDYVLAVEKQRVLDRLSGEMYNNYLVKQNEHFY